jgi:hypothetical protein
MFGGNLIRLSKTEDVMGALPLPEPPAIFVIGLSVKRVGILQHFAERSRIDSRDSSSLSVINSLPLCHLGIRHWQKSGSTQQFV